MGLLHFFRTPGLSRDEERALLQRVQRRIAPAVRSIATEYCFNVHADGELSDGERRVLTWLLSETFQPEGFGTASFLADGSRSDGEDATTERARLLEVGPRMSFTTAWSTNAVSVCHACGLDRIRRIERSRRYRLGFEAQLSDREIEGFLAEVHDRMTECLYPEPLTSFDTGVEPESVRRVPVLEEGRAALEKINREMGLAFDDWWNVSTSPSPTASTPVTGSSRAA
jgi:phosphoribosylformylglycinamidine synthase